MGLESGNVQLVPFFTIFCGVKVAEPIHRHGYAAMDRVGRDDTGELVGKRRSHESGFVPTGIVIPTDVSL